MTDDGINNSQAPEPFAPVPPSVPPAAVPPTAAVAPLVPPYAAAPVPTH
ncbi:MAG: stress protein, partial [Coriobacteriia bacterium]|nr:stress protein [Coriobacteriia bacterium]